MKKCAWCKKDVLRGEEHDIRACVQTRIAAAKKDRKDREDLAEKFKKKGGKQ